MRAAWDELENGHKSPEYFGDPPKLWKTVGDEVIFTKLLSDHRQVAVTIQCWVEALKSIREFLNRDNSRLGVKSTAWIAGFPFRNKEVVLSGESFSGNDVIDDYYKENGLILNKFYSDEKNGNKIIIDYVGPSIDTGFRLTGLSSSRKLIVSLEVAYILSLTSPVKNSPIEPIKIRYDGQVTLKGVLGGAGYPVFWLDLSVEDSAAFAEDKLTKASQCDRDDVKAFCDAFFAENKHYIFPPFICSDTEAVLKEKPEWYDDHHDNLIKNFDASLSEPTEPEESESPITEIDFRDGINKFRERVQDLARKGIKDGTDNSEG